MVRAILAGKKTQTRRIIKFPKNWDGGTIYGNQPFGLKYEDSDGLVHRLNQKWQPGDRLWVRETFYNEAVFGEPPVWIYRADTPDYPLPCGSKWKPSIFMPRAASRILLEVTDVRFERLNDISEHDAEQEGFVSDWAESGFSAVNSFAELWDDINGEGSFDSDTFVWVITFKSLHT